MDGCCFRILPVFYWHTKWSCYWPNWHSCWHKCHKGLILLSLHTSVALDTWWSLNFSFWFSFAGYTVIWLCSWVQTWQELINCLRLWTLLKQPFPIIFLNSCVVQLWCGCCISVVKDTACSRDVNIQCEHMWFIFPVTLSHPSQQCHRTHHKVVNPSNLNMDLPLTGKSSCSNQMQCRISHAPMI